MRIFENSERGMLNAAIFYRCLNVRKEEAVPETVYAVQIFSATSTFS